MHEYSIIQSLMTRVESEAAAHNASSVHRLSIRIGELSGVEPELLRTAYETYRVGTICATAELDINRIAAEYRCPLCSAVLERGEILQCPECKVPARLMSGDEIMLDRIELEVQ